MKNKTPLALMEQLVMILIFAAAAAFCLRLFLTADQTSKRNEALSQAVILAQNTAEEFKHSQPEILEETCIYYNRDWNETTKEEGIYRLEIREEESSVQGLSRVRIEVFDAEGLLFGIPASWQED